MSAQTLRELIAEAGLGEAELRGDGDALVAEVTQDSRAVAAGWLFVAVPGFTVDGHGYLEAALGAGAAGVVVQADQQAQWGALANAGAPPVVVVPDTRSALPRLAAAFHGFPGRRLTVVGVTGTDGKTTTTYVVQSMLEAAGHRCGLIGGVQFQVGDSWEMNTLTQTSPEADLIQRLLGRMAAAGQTHVAMEATSHGLSLHRLDGCEFDVGVFTGLSDDHLDFHKTREAYLDAKLELFRSLEVAARKPGVEKAAVVFHDDPHADAVRAATRARVVTVGLGGVASERVGAAVSVSDVQESAEGSAFRLVTPGGALGTRLALPGRFNVRNALSAAGAGYALGLPIGALVEGIRALPGVPGRMERIEAGQDFTVIVDAAATEAALRTVLESVRGVTAGRVIVVFGCAGGRDIARGEGMGRAAAALADSAVVTNENPRSADPGELVRAIGRAMEEAGSERGVDFEEVVDRREAIARGLSLARAGDVVLVAGKGAEQSMIYADRVEAWDDRVVVREVLGSRGRP